MYCGPISIITYMLSLCLFFCRGFTKQGYQCQGKTIATLTCTVYTVPVCDHISFELECAILNLCIRKYHLRRSLCVSVCVTESIEMCSVMLWSQ